MASYSLRFVLLMYEFGYFKESGYLCRVIAMISYMDRNGLSGSNRKQRKK